MRVVPERQYPDGPSNMDMFLRYVCVFLLGMFVHWMIR